MQQSDKIILSSTPWRDLRQMGIGEIKFYPLSKTTSIRTMCTRAGFEQEKKFVTAINRIDRTISVTRTR